MSDGSIREAASAAESTGILSSLARATVTEYLADTEPASNRWADGLRELADWIEQHDDILGEQLCTDVVTLWLGYDSKESFQEYVRALGRGTKKEILGDLHLERSFGMVKVSGYTARENVCKRVVVGTKTETVLKPDPSVDVPMVEVTETVEQVEWICGPLLAEGVPS